MEDITLTKSLIDSETAKGYFEAIFASIQWHKELTTADGQKVKINRRMAYVSDNPITYKYANLQLPGGVWNAPLLAIKAIVEEAVGSKFNSVLLNLYDNGKDKIRWHSDKETQLGDNPVIACINLGAPRNFWFLEKESGVKSSQLVQNGDLLVMGPNCQQKYLHAILKEKEVTEARISLTFRWVYDLQEDLHQGQTDAIV